MFSWCLVPTKLPSVITELLLKLLSDGRWEAGRHRTEIELESEWARLLHEKASKKAKVHLPELRVP